MASSQAASDAESGAVTLLTAGEDLENPPDLNAVLRVMAEMQRELLRMQRDGGGPRKSRFALSQIKIPDFDGHERTSTRQYREWKKSLEIIQVLNQLTDQELALLIFSQVKGRAKNLIEIMEPEDLRKSDALNMIYNIFDDSFEKMDHERLDGVHQEWEKAARRPGQPMTDWITYVRKKRMELQLQDSASAISDTALASKMLRGAGLSHKERSQTMFNCGGLYDSKRMETVLKVAHSKLHEQEKKGNVLSRRSPLSTSQRSQGFREVRSQARSSRGVASPKTAIRGRFSSVHETEQLEGEVQHDDDFDETEQDQYDDYDDEDYEVYLEDQEQGKEHLEEVQDAAEGEEEEMEQEEELQEAFAAGWRAKQKTAALRLKRGFVAPKPREERGASGGLRPPSAKSSLKPDQRKQSSRCADCGRLGHWKGDPECPKVASGERQPFKKKPNGEVNGSSKPIRIHGPVINWVHGPVINWVGVTNAEEEEEKPKHISRPKSHTYIPPRDAAIEENEDLGMQVEVRKIVANTHDRGHSVVIRVPTQEMALHLEKRVNENRNHLWFPSGTCHRVKAHGSCEITLQVTTSFAANALDTKEIAATISKIIRLDSMTQEEASAAAASDTKEERAAALATLVEELQDSRALASTAMSRRAQMANAAAAAAAEETPMASAVASASAVEGHQKEAAVASAAAAAEETPMAGAVASASAVEGHQAAASAAAAERKTKSDMRSEVWKA